MQLVGEARHGDGIFARLSGSGRGDGVGAAEVSVDGGSGGLDVVLWEHLHFVASAGGVCKGYDLVSLLPPCLCVWKRGAVGSIQRGQERPGLLGGGVFTALGYLAQPCC